MECNKDEALRAMEIAERKFLVKDFKGAKKFALKARNLYPELDGISQMLMTVDVYISAGDETIGESNWYRVLGVYPFSDDTTIRKQYRKLALLLHPDKNRSIGADGAFQLVSQAWSVLSDKSKRRAYDKSRYECGLYDLSKTGSAEVSAPNKTSKKDHSSVRYASHEPKKRRAYDKSGYECGLYDLSSAEVSAPEKTSKRDHSSVRYASHVQKIEAFWTVCLRCKSQYEHLMYPIYIILCPNCREEIGPPSNRDSKTLFQNIGFRLRKSNHPGSQSANDTVPPDICPKVYR